MDIIFNNKWINFFINYGLYRFRKSHTPKIDFIIYGFFIINNEIIKMKYMRCKYYINWHSGMK